MSWHYALVKTECDLKQDTGYSLVEAHPELVLGYGSGTMYYEGVTFSGETPEEVINELETAIANIKKHGVINEG